MAIKTIEAINPAIIGYTISGLILLYFSLKQNIYRLEIMISSLFFIVSGFLFQIIFDKLSILKNFASEYHDIFSIPVFTIFATALGIFLGNTILRYTEKIRKQKEISIIFVNTISSQIKFLANINDILFSDNILSQNSFDYLEQQVDFSKIYFTQLEDKQNFNVAFKKIGIYPETEIECISLYSTQKQQLISMINNFLLSLQFEKSRKKYLILKSYPYFSIIKLFIITTIYLGFICLIRMSEFYSLEKMNDYKQDFENFYINALWELNNILGDSGLNKEWFKDFMENLELVKNFYKDRFTEV